MRAAIMRLCLCLAAVLPARGLTAAEPSKDTDTVRVLVAKDAAGRVQTRTELKADGSRHVTSRDYWPDSGVARLTVDEERDSKGRPTKRVTEEFDETGRLRERLDVAIDVSGRERGKRTLFSYDATGQPRETASPVVR